MYGNVLTVVQWVQVRKCCSPVIESITESIEFREPWELDRRSPGKPDRREDIPAPEPAPLPPPPPISSPAMLSEVPWWTGLTNFSVNTIKQAATVWILNSNQIKYCTLLTILAGISDGPILLICYELKIMFSCTVQTYDSWLYRSSCGNMQTKVKVNQWHWQEWQLHIQSMESSIQSLIIPRLE